MTRSRNTKAKRMKSEENRYFFLLLCCGRLELDDYTHDETHYGSDVYKLPVTECVVGSRENEGAEEAFTDILRDTNPVDDQFRQQSEVTEKAEDFPDELFPFADDDVYENESNVHYYKEEMKQTSNSTNIFSRKRVKHIC